MEFVERLTLKAGGREFMVEMLNDVAPITCAAIGELLPISGQLIHGALSGPEVFVEIPAAEPIPLENWTSNTLPGDVCYYFQPGGMIDRPHDMAEICLFYARGGSPRSPEGPARVNVFGRVAMHQLDQLGETMRAIRRQGPLGVAIDRHRD